MEYFVNKFTPLLIAPEGRAKHFDLNPGAVVEVEEPDHALVAATYVTNEGVEKFGFLNREHIEPYIENFPKNCVKIPFQTANPNDFEQYLVYEGKKQVNACGELCVAYILGLEFKDVIENWKIKSPTLWQRIVKKGVWRGTGAGELVELFSVFGVEAQLIPLKRYTISGLKDLLDRGDVIVSCNIGYDGRFKGKEILHWIALKDVIPERQWGWVDVYNPAPNRIERYEWERFLASCNQPYGVFVEAQ